MTPDITLRSLGAAQTVTGSKHLLETPERKILIDCGLFQGLKALRLKNWEPLPVEAATIDAVLLTHAHLDHCGYLPLLVKQGFKGRIYMTAPTRDLTEIILRDAAKIQEEDAERANERHFSKHHPALPLYTVEDVELALQHFTEVEHSTDIQLFPEIRFRFVPNGHILGSCCIAMHCYGKHIVFSGDLGRPHSAYLSEAMGADGVDFVVMESTYGNRLHEQVDPMDELADIILRTLKHNGTVIIPSFAVGRAQEIMFLLEEMKQLQMIPQSLPIFVDSPMAADATDVLLRYPEWHEFSKENCQKMKKDVHINREYKGTFSILDRHGSKVVIAASGMLTGGRVLEYIKALGSDEDTSIVLVGFQAEGTRGRALLNQASELKIFGEFVPIRAKVYEIRSLSAHADQAELLRWLRPFKKTKPKVFLVHGEGDALQTLRVKIESELGLGVTINQQGEAITLFSLPEPALTK